MVVPQEGKLGTLVLVTEGPVPSTRCRGPEVKGQAFGFLASIKQISPKRPRFRQCASTSVRAFEGVTLLTCSFVLGCSLPPLRCDYLLLTDDPDISVH